MRTLWDRSNGGEYASYLYDLPPYTVGNTFFVSSTGGSYSSSSGPGYTPRQAFLTIDQAVGACTANNGDQIIVLPGHTETITAAGGLALDVAGITLIGLGEGRMRPKIEFTTSTSATMTVTAANVTMRGMYPRSGGFYFDLTAIDALANPISVSAADFALLDCDVETGDSGGQCGVALLTTAAADRLRVERCFFYGDTTAGTTNVLQLIGGDAIQILDNVFQGNYTTSLGAINNITTAMTNVIIGRNVINNRTASSTKAIVLLSTTTGHLFENYMQILSGTAPITGAAVSWSGNNRYANSIGAPDVGV